MTNFFEKQSLKVIIFKALSCLRLIHYFVCEWLHKYNKTMTLKKKIIVQLTHISSHSWVCREYPTQKRFDELLFLLFVFYKPEWNMDHRFAAVITYFNISSISLSDFVIFCQSYDKSFVHYEWQIKKSLDILMLVVKKDIKYKMSNKSTSKKIVEHNH